MVTGGYLEWYEECREKGKSKVGKMVGEIVVEIREDLWSYW